MQQGEENEIITSQLAFTSSYGDFVVVARLEYLFLDSVLRQRLLPRCWPRPGG